MTGPAALKLADPSLGASRLEVPADVRLAVLVVYHFDDALQRLVNVHLDYLRRHIPMSSTIFGAAIRLKPEHHDWLANQPNVHLPKLGPLPKGFRAEHNGALDRLAEIAFAEGATHVATFHQDSFPVRSDWLDRLLIDLDDKTPFAVAERRAFNCCMLWGRDWQAQNPTMLASATLRERAAEALMARRPDLDARDGGYGHLLLAELQGVGWRAMRHTAPDIIDDMVLHLTGSTRIAHKNRVLRQDTKLASSLRSIFRPVFPYLPTAIRKRAGRAVGIQALANLNANIGVDGSAQEKHSQITRLVANPETYIFNALREPLYSEAQWENQRPSTPSASN